MYVAPAPEFSCPGGKGCSDEDAVSEDGNRATEPSPVTLTMQGGEKVAVIIEEISSAVEWCRVIVRSSDQDVVSDSCNCSAEVGDEVGVLSAN